MDENTQIKRMFLNLDRVQQVDMLMNTPTFSMFLELSKIALDAPLSEGGIPTEIIEDCRRVAEKNW
jgi:hypothetical protein